MINDTRQARLDLCAAGILLFDGDVPDTLELDDIVSWLSGDEGQSIASEAYDFN